MIDKKLGREFRNGHYEKTEDGSILLPKSGLKLSGVFSHDIRRNGELLGEMHDSNIVVNQGLDHALGVIFSSDTVTPVTAWYIGIFEGNYTPLATDTSANITANSTECIAYNEAARQAFVEGAVASQTIDNLASKATFTINAVKTVYGAFLVSNSAKSGTTGTLFSASRFGTQRDVIANDQLLVGYQLVASDV